MFPVPDKRRQGPITVHPALRRAATLARAFILLEDPELSGSRTPDGEPPHPHRVPLRSLGGTRRPGAVVPREQRCLSPVIASVSSRPRPQPTPCHAALASPATCSATHASR